MKINPQSLRCRRSRVGCNPLSNQQKVTKLTKVSWRAELCNVAQVHNSRVTSSPAFAQLRRASQELAPPFVRLFASFVIFCFIGICFSAVCASSSAQTPDSVAERE